MKSPYSVLYYIHDKFSNYLDAPKVKYNQILLEEEANIRAKKLLNSIKSYYRIYKKGGYDLRTYVVDNENNIIKEYK